MIEASRDEWRRAIECALSSGEVADGVAQAGLARLAESAAPAVGSDLVSTWLGLPVGPCERFLDFVRTLDRVGASPPRMTMPTLADPPPDPERTLPPALSKEPSPAAPARKRGEWPPSVPHRLGPYELEEILGEGGMGLVFRARHTTLGTPCAVKVVTDARHKERFLTEAKSVAAMGRHPNIVSVYDLGEEKGLPYYAMELVTGRPLAHDFADRHKQGRDYSSEEIARLLEKVARAVHFAHQHNVIHRDLTPNNVIVRDDGEPQVMDFGLARQTDVAERRSVVGVPMGTPHYMSPEQAKGDVEGMDARTDVYGLGAILYEMLTRNPPHPGTPQQALVHAVRGDDPPRPRAVSPHVSRDLETICLKALEAESARRYPTAKEFADELRRHLDGEPLATIPLARVTRLWRRAKKHRSVVIPSVVATLLALALAVGVGVPAFLRSRGLRTSLEAARAFRERGDFVSARVQYEKAKEIESSNAEAADGLTWAARAEEESHWAVVYEGPSRDEQLSDAWLGSPGLEGEWSIDGETLVGKPTTEPQTLIVLMRRTTEDLRVRFDVNGYDGRPGTSFGFFLASDPRGWEHGNPQSTEYDCGTGYLVRFQGDRVGVVKGRDLGHPLQERPLPALPGMGDWLHVEIERMRGRFVVSVASGKSASLRVLECSDLQPLETKAGEVHDFCGFYWYSKPLAAVRFREVRLTAREVDLAANAHEGDIEAAAVLFERGQYAEHRKRIDRILTDPALSEDARRGLHAQMDRAMFYLTWNADTPEDLLAECHLALRTGLDEYHMARLGGAIPYVATSASWDALLGDLAGVLQSTPNSAAARLVQASLLFEGRRESEAMRVIEEAPSEVRVTPEWLGARFSGLLAVGRRKEACEMASAADRAYFHAEDGACEELEGLLAKGGLTAPWHFATILAYRKGTPPSQAMIDRLGWDPWSVVGRGLLAGNAKSTEAIVACWKTVPEAECAALPMPLPRIDSPMGNPKLAEWRQPVERGFVRYLAGRGEESAAERFVVRNLRDQRAWLRLALAIRAEADGRRDAAIRHYELCRDDCLGEEFPREWAVSAIERLKRK